jgi:hypothetical protein
MPKEIPAKEAIPEVQKAIPEIQEGLPGAKEAIPEAKATLPEVKEAISEVTTAPPEVPVIKPVIKEEPPQTPSQQGPIRLALLIKPHAAPTAEDAAKVTQEGYQDRRVVGFETRAGAKSGINGEVPVLRLPVRPKDKKETPPEPLNAAMAELRGLVEKAEGKVIEVKYNNDTGLPQSLRAVIPSGRYKGFVLSLVLVGSFNEGAAVGEAAARQGPVTVDIDLISADK